MTFEILSLLCCILVSLYSKIQHSKDNIYSVIHMFYHKNIFIIKICLYHKKELMYHLLAFHLTAKKIDFLLHAAGLIK